MSIFNRKSKPNSRSLGVKTIEDDERSAGKLLLWVTFLMLASLLTWAHFSVLDEITKGQGKIIPTSREQIIQSLDSGVLSQMNVREGDEVKKGQVLLQIDAARSGAVFRESKEKYVALLAVSSRLKAEAYGGQVEFPSALKNESALKEQELKAFRARKQALNQALEAINGSIDNVENEIKMTEPMVKQGVVSEVEVLRLRRQLSDLKGQRAEKQNRYLTDANNELTKVQSELSQTKEAVSAREDAFRRTTITSPMQGVVKNVQVTTLGGVIQAGQPIMEIVPTEEEMLVEAYVKPSEVAFLKIGQKAVVKLSSYDFNKYGGLDAILENISPDTLRDEKQRKPGNPVELEEGLFRIMLRIKDQNMNRKGIELKPSPGMTASVEIRTGQKTILEYVFRPLQNVTLALRER